MTQEKMGKVITACVSAGTVLLVCLLSFLAYQWITIATYNNRINKIENEIATLEMQLEEAEKYADGLQTELWLKLKLNELNELKDLIKDKN